MSTIDEIKTALSNLTTEELYGVERSIHQLYRRRNARIIYDDAHGVWTEEDQTSAAAEAWGPMDQQEGAAENADA